MNYRPSFALVFLLAISCSRTDSNAPIATVPALANPSRTATIAQPDEPSPDYPGKTIDDIFPITAHYSAIDDDGREKEMAVDVAGFSEVVRNYVPVDLRKNGRIEFRFKKREVEGYWGTLVGLAHLRGPNQSEIYTVVSGPGGVCCTNYSIVDISSSKPRSIFHSEDFGSFRNPMEIFDAEGDGVYELVQFDSCFRYFMDDCGSCSPEPRAYFKYDRRSHEYKPTAGLIQDFVKQQLTETETWLKEKDEERRQTKSISIQADVQRALRAYVVDLLYVGEEKRAWQTFDKYADDSAKEVRGEIKRILRSCKFYQQLKRG